jgi:tRNA threonylcarbamoyladenosine modification (KEOPS) complex  Pcc1 subunit
MGSFRASLALGGKEFDVLYSDYAFTRETDKKGKVSSNVYGGRVTVEIESTEDSSVIEAMLNSQFKSVEGTITFKKTDEDAKLKEVTFRNAYLVYYKETLDVTGEVPMKIRFTVSAEEIEIGNAKIDNRWPKA